ncbi:MAG: transcriptional regulator [archaeon]|nr:transcriptional regulator [archaeon]
MVDYLSFIYGKLLFTKEDFVQFTGNSASAGVTLRNYVKRGLIANIRRNLYCACNLATKLPEAGKMQIASALSGTACVSYHSALEYHGLGHQVFYCVYVQSETRFNTFNFDGIEYKYYKQVQKCGIQNMSYDKMVRVTDLERTIIDCCDRIDLAGGIEELLHCLENTPMVNEKKMLDYLKVFDKAVLFKKVGYVMEVAGIKLSQEFFDTCMMQSRKSVSYLESNTDKVFVAKWRLYVPEYMKQLTEDYQDAII